jgi:hypothetical protein
MLVPRSARVDTSNSPVPSLDQRTPCAVGEPARRLHRDAVATIKPGKTDAELPDQLRRFLVTEVCAMKSRVPLLAIVPRFDGFLLRQADAVVRDDQHLGALSKLT